MPSRTRTRSIRECSTTCAGWPSAADKRLKVVANLPYHVATPVITNFLVHPELCPVLMVVTIQRELAERMCAEAASPAYGAVSILVQALADVSIVRTLPPIGFLATTQGRLGRGRPAARSSKRAAVADVAWFHDFVRSVFLHRRKYIRHVLAEIWRDRWTKMEVDVWLEWQGISGQIRAEALDIEEFLAMAHALHERWGTLPVEVGDSGDENRSQGHVPGSDRTFHGREPSRSIVQNAVARSPRSVDEVSNPSDRARRFSIPRHRR